MFTKNLQFRNLPYKAVPVWQGLHNTTMAMHKEVCCCVNKIQQCCLMFLYNNVLSVAKFSPLNEPLIQRLTMLVVIL